MSDLPTVIDNGERHRFELVSDGYLAQLVYRRTGDQLVLVHTEVPAELGGRSLGGVLVTAAVDLAVADGLVVVPECSFARVWLKRHPDVAGRVEIAAIDL